MGALPLCPAESGTVAPAPASSAQDFAVVDCGLTPGGHLLECNDQTTRLTAEFNMMPGARRLLSRHGTIVLAAIISARSSTKSERGDRDPDMHQTRKRNIDVAAVDDRRFTSKSLHADS